MSSSSGHNNTNSTLMETIFHQSIIFFIASYLGVSVECWWSFQFCPLKDITQGNKHYNVSTLSQPFYRHQPISLNRWVISLFEIYISLYLLFVFHVICVEHDKRLSRTTQDAKTVQRKKEVKKHSLISVDVWLEWTLNFQTKILSLNRSQLGQLSVDVIQVKSSDLLIKNLW